MPDENIDTTLEEKDEQNVDQNDDGNQDTGDSGNQDDKGAESWLDALPEEIRNSERINNFGSVEEALSAFVSAELASAPPETYTLPEGIPEQFGDWAKEQKLSQGQTDAIIALNGSMQKSAFEAKQQKYLEGQEALYADWGDSKGENLNLAKRTLKLADPEGKLGLAKFLNGPESGFEGNNPRIIAALANIGMVLKEGGFIKSEIPDKREVVELAHRLYPNDVPK